MTSEEYQRGYGSLARKALRYAAEMTTDDDPSYVTNERDHWIKVFLDERLPDIDADALLEVTPRVDAFEKSTSRPAPRRDIPAFQPPWSQTRSPCERAQGVRGGQMTSVSLRIRQITSRVPFRGGTFIATLEQEGGDYLTLGTTRGHDTWAAAAAAALRLADARGYIVFHRPLIERRIAKDGVDK